MRRYISNDTECRAEPSGDEGFEVCIVDASTYDALASELDDLRSAVKDLLRRWEGTYDRRYCDLEPLRNLVAVHGGESERGER